MADVNILIEGKSFPRFNGTSVLIRNGRENIIVDTGLQYHRKSLISAISNRNLDLNDIDMVINTHLHIDHCGNNALFKRARYIFHKAEYEFLGAVANLPREKIEEIMPKYYPDLSPNQLRAFSGLMVRHSQALEYLSDPEVKRRLFLVEDQVEISTGVSLIMTPGHTHGHISVLVKDRTKNSRICIAGDAWATHEQSAPGIIAPFKLTADIQQFTRNKKNIESCSDIIIPGHDKIVSRIQCGNHQPVFRKSRGKEVF